jgi:hypothetical protein
MRKHDAQSAKLLAPKQVAAIEGAPSSSMLKVYRTQRANRGNVPQSVKINGRVYYHVEDVQRWLDEKQRL